jgi:hypothetical protein
VDALNRRNVGKLVRLIYSDPLECNCAIAAFLKSTQLDNYRELKMTSRKISDKLKKRFTDGSECDIISSVRVSTYSKEGTKAFEFVRKFHLTLEDTTPIVILPVSKLKGNEDLN